MSVDWVGRPDFARSVFPESAKEKKEILVKETLVRDLQNKVLGLIKTVCDHRSTPQNV